MFADAVPLPLPARSEPRHVPLVGSDALEIVVVDATRTKWGKFLVRVYPDGHPADEVQAKELWLLYGTEVHRVTRWLEAAWAMRELRPHLREEAKPIIRYTHQGQYLKVVAAIRELQAHLLP
jgi:hypothetical protein